jgi:hypothetical protein
MLVAMNLPRASRIVLATCCLAVMPAQDRAEDSDMAPFSVAAGLFDASRPDTLGLTRAPGAETLTVFRPGDGDNAYNHGAVVTAFRGRLYVQWQTSRRDEDAPDTHVVYSTSTDGRGWSRPVSLTRPRTEGMTTSGGWWVDGGQLVAYINEWGPAAGPGRDGRTSFVASRDGETWPDPEPVRDAGGRPIAGIFEQDPKALPGGRIIGAFHALPGLIAAPWYTDDPSGVTGWIRASMPDLPHAGDTGRAIEPSWFLRGDGAVVMVFRDQQSSYRKLAAVSHDRGATWSRPALTDMPDARTKQSAGNLPGGSAYLVGNPVSGRSRFPLVLALSRDGRVFERAWLLRAGGAELPPVRYPGRYKRAGYSYPKSAVLGDWLYVAYATNKEDIELTRIPVRRIAAW